MRTVLLSSLVLLQLAAAGTRSAGATAAAAAAGDFLTCDSGEQSGSAQALICFFVS
jgi:hypothetical protein